MAKPPKKTGDDNVSQVYSQYEAMQMLKPNFDASVDKIALESDLAFATTDTMSRLRSASSTGILCNDLVTNGGFGAGRMSYLYGPSGAGKSTFLYHGLLSALNRGTRCYFIDHEACADPQYLENIGYDFAKFSGIRGSDGKWKVPPLFAHSEGLVGEKTFQGIMGLLKNLPYKVEMFDDHDKEFRYFMVDEDYDFKKTWSSINHGLKEKKIFEIEDFSPQAIFAIDSVKAMLPESKWEKPDGNPMAILARMLAEHFPMIKTLLARKHSSLLLTNHISINPMAMFQNPETEPGGNAVKFWPDLKLRVDAKSTEKSIIVEKTIDGYGVDRYRPGTVKVMKNKGGSSFRSVEYRIWLDSSGKPGMGIDPVFDTYKFLEMTNQLGFSGKKKAEWKVLLPGFDAEPMDWAKFKAFVLSDNGEKLRATCFKQVSAGVAQTKYYDWLSTSPAPAKKGSKPDDEGGGSGEGGEDSTSDEDIDALLNQDTDTDVTV